MIEMFCMMGFEIVYEILGGKKVLVDVLGVCVCSLNYKFNVDCGVLNFDLFVMVKVFEMCGNKMLEYVVKLCVVFVVFGDYFVLFMLEVC